MELSKLSFDSLSSVKSYRLASSHAYYTSINYNVQFILQPILVYMSKVDGRFKFSPVSVNFLTEVAKVIFAVVMLLIQVLVSSFLPLNSHSSAPFSLSLTAKCLFAFLVSSSVSQISVSCSSRYMVRGSSTSLGYLLQDVLA